MTIHEGATVNTKHSSVPHDSFKVLSNTDIPTNRTFNCSRNHTISRPNLLNVPLTVSCSLLQIYAGTINIQKGFLVVRSPPLVQNPYSSKMFLLEDLDAIASAIIPGTYSKIWVRSSDVACSSFCINVYPNKETSCFHYKISFLLYLWARPYSSSLYPHYECTGICCKLILSHIESTEQNNRGKSEMRP